MVCMQGVIFSLQDLERNNVKSPRMRRMRIPWEVVYCEEHIICVCLFLLYFNAYFLTSVFLNIHSLLKCS